MQLRVRGLVRLTRYREYVFFVVVTTLIGAAAGQGSFGWPLLGVLAANWLAVGFAFMINDVEDAPDDALNPAKVRRNPVSAGELPVRTAQAASFGVAALAALLYWLLGWWPFVTGLACLLLAHLYSWRGVRLKTRPGWDLLSHCLMLAGLQFLAAYLTFVPASSMRWLFPFVFVVALSLYGQLFNEMRDMEGDLRAGLKHSAVILGPQITHWAMMLLLAAALVSAAVTIVIDRLFPPWVLILLAVLEAAFVLPAAWSARHKRSAMEVQAPFHMPAQHAGAIAMSIWFVAAPVNDLWQVWGLKLLAFAYHTVGRW